MTATYAANGQRQAHRVQHCGGDRAVVEGVPDAVVATEKASLIGAHFAQVEGRQGQASCGRRDEREEQVSREEVEVSKFNPDQEFRPPQNSLLRTQFRTFGKNMHSASCKSGSKMEEPTLGW